MLRPPLEQGIWERMEKIPRKDWRFIKSIGGSIIRSEGLPPNRFHISYDKEEDTARVEQVGGEYNIILNPDLSKKEIESYLRHEVTHVKEGIPLLEDLESNVSLYANSELGALLGEGYMSPYDIGDIINGIVQNYGMSPGEAVSIVVEEARKLHIPRSTIQKAKRLYWEWEREEGSGR